MPEPALPQDLLDVIAHLHDPAQIAQLLQDLLTPAETGALAERWGIVKLLAAGNSQRAVRDEVGVSITTVSRGSRQLRYGSGGFGLAFDTLGVLGLADPREDP
jgi:Trp operon repressor